MDKHGQEKTATEARAQERPIWRRFEVVDPKNEDALNKMMHKRKLDRADLYLLFTTLRLRPELTDTFETCHQELAARYGWKEPE